MNPLEEFSRQPLILGLVFHDTPCTLDKINTWKLFADGKIFARGFPFCDGVFLCFWKLYSLLAIFMLETLKWSKTLKSSRDDFNFLNHFNVSSIKKAIVSLSSTL